jgi:hypothetical protein
LDIAGPVARVGKSSESQWFIDKGEAMVGGVGVDLHKDGFDLRLPMITYPRIAMFFFGQFAEWCRGFVIPDDVAWGNHIFESVAFGDFSAFLAVPSDDEDGVVFCDHFSHWRVSTNKLCWGNFDVKLTGQIDAAFCFCLATTIGEENIRATGRQK